MARADYDEQMKRHAGEWDVLPQGLVVPSLPHGSEWQRGSCRGIALLSDESLQGNRWPAVSGALLAELANRCATLAALTVVEPRQRPRPRQIAIRFRKAIPVADARRRPHVADDARALFWDAAVEGDPPEFAVKVRLTRRPAASSEAVLAVEAHARFATMDADAASRDVERRMADYLFYQPRRLALPAYHLGWKETEIHGACVERPGSLLAAAEQALGDAGKIVRGDGAPPDVEESMLLADMKYRWLEDVDDACATYVSRPGTRRADDKGRIWMEASTVLSLGERRVGEATGNVVFQRRRSTDR